MRFSSYEDNQEGQVACGEAAYGFLTLTGSVVTQEGNPQDGTTSPLFCQLDNLRPHLVVIYFTHLMPTVERITKASRIIVRQEGVGLSMLRNVKNDCIKNKHERNNQPYSRFFVTLLYKNSVLEVLCHC